MIRLAAGGAMLLAATAALAGGARLVQLPGAAGCLSQRVPGCTKAGLGSPYTAAVSPDGRSLYLVGGVGSTGTLAVYRRDPQTGALATMPPKRGCIHVYHGSANCVAGRALETPTGVVVSPDGRFVYVAAGSNGAVTTFVRRPDGSLVQPAGRAACVSSISIRCDPASALEHPVSIAIAADGRHVYAIGNSMIAVLVRNRSTGRLAQTGCVNRLGVRGCTKMAEGSRLYRGTLAASRDGRNLYVASNAVVYVFDRDPQTGALTEASCFDAGGTGGCAAVEGLGRPQSIAVSSDGKRVLAAGDATTVVPFARFAASGALTPLEPVGLPFRAVSVAAARRLLAVGGVRGAALVADDALAGSLARLRGLREVYTVAGSPDGRSVYAAGIGGVAVLAAR